MKSSWMWFIFFLVNTKWRIGNIDTWKRELVTSQWSQCSVWCFKKVTHIVTWAVNHQAKISSRQRFFISSELIKTFSIWIPAIISIHNPNKNPYQHCDAPHLILWLVTRGLNIVGCFCLMPQNFWKVLGPMIATLSFRSCRLINGDTQRRWGHLNPICCYQIYLNILHSELVGTLQHLSHTPHALTLFIPTRTFTTWYLYTWRLWDPKHWSF